MERGEMMAEVQGRTQLLIGEGAIDPDSRVRAGEITELEIDDFVEGLKSDEFWDELETGLFIPTKCVDGRGRKDGKQELGPNSSGGTFTLVVADALTNDAYREPGEKASQHAIRLYGELKKQGYRIGGHDDDHAQGDKCGCGAEDRLDDEDPKQPSILRYMARRGDDIRQLVASLGVEINDELHAKLVQKSGQLVDERYATSGAELRGAFIEVGGDESVETLAGLHQEVALVVHTQEGKTLNRAKLRQKYGDNMQAFNLDVAPLQKATALIALNETEAHEKFVAALYYNVATAAVLGGASLRLVVK